MFFRRAIAEILLGDIGAEGYERELIARMGSLEGGLGCFGVAPVLAPDVDFPRRLKAQIQLLDGAGL